MSRNLMLSHERHSTEHELAFLKDLGTYGEKPLAPRALLLRRYLAAMALRVEWGGIRPDTVRQYVVGELRKERET